MSRSEAPRPTGTGLALAATGTVLVAVGWAAGYVELLAIGLCCPVLLAAAVLAVARLPGIDVERTLGSGRVMAGEQPPVTLIVRNRGRFRSPALQAVDHLAGEPVAVRIPPLGPGRVWTHRVTLPPQQRGVHPIGPLEVERADPLRLVRRRLRRGGADRLVVYPTVHRYGSLLRGAQRERSTGAQASGDVGFTNLRAYVPGDDHRTIHWPSSARLGTLLVRERMSPDEPRLTLVLDTSRGGYAGCPDPAEAFEDAVRVAASLAAAAQRLGRPVSVRCTDGRAVAGGVRRAGLEPVLDLLATLSTADGHPGLEALSQLAPGRDDDTLVVVGGALPPARTLALVRHRYTSALLIRIGPIGPIGATGTAEPAVPPGIQLIRAATSAELAGR